MVVTVDYETGRVDRASVLFGGAVAVLFDAAWCGLVWLERNDRKISRLVFSFLFFSFALFFQRRFCEAKSVS